jgi:4-hydroxybenzoate polyprenyltransferase
MNYQVNQLKTISKLLRVEQWYKNSVVFIALVFSGNLFDMNLFFISGLAFISLCLVSSANYIINDLRDKKKDNLHPIKKYRVIAAKLISGKEAKLWVVGLLIFGFVIAYLLNAYFFVLLFFLFLLMQVYTFWLKHYLYLDVMMIASFFVIRVVLGAFAIMVWVSPWLIVCPFFLAVLLVSSKRYADLALYSKKIATKTRKVLGKYSLKSAKLLMGIGAGMLILSFVMYSLQKNIAFLLSIPFAGIAIWRYLKLVSLNPLIGLQSEKALKDWKLVIIGILWVMVILMILY